MATVIPGDLDEVKDTQKVPSATGRRKRGEGKPRKNFPCHLCEKAFNSVEKLKVHSYSHTGERPYRCSHPDCSKAFVSKYKLLRHMATHSPEKTHKCNYCEKMFHRKDHLKNHLHTHDPNKEAFSCEECGKSYNTKLGFRRHQALHSANAGDLTCRVCLQTFPSTAELLEHLKSHAGKSSGGAKEKKHQCEHCDRRFYTRKDVRRHMVVHTGRKDFLCQYCAQRFGRKDHLTRHVKKSHTKELLKVKTEPLDLLDPFACGVPLPVKAELQSMMAMASGELGVYASPAQVDQAAGPLAMACPLAVEHAGLSAHQHPLKYQPGSTSYSMPGSEKEQPLKGEIESYLMELQNSMPSSSGDVAVPGAKLDLTSPVGALDEASVDASLSKLPGMAASDPLPSSSSSLDFSQLFNFLPLNGPLYGQPVPGSSLGIGYVQEEALSLPQPQDPSEPGGSMGLGALHGLSSPFTSNTGATTLPRFHQAFQ
ncbi:zinc finger protein PLAG1 isoform X1 [Brienomyrus brachyistius]|uniref:zinc finger protein PLAG1 isoform X1 n=2 Tax=Brienomyrus brachyistius TaxID=42636 RepID=UPI0020B22126|nr:zinc finger protein PLAG1 isoform X1 [Brienomyrus brachyistius]